MDINKKILFGIILVTLFSLNVKGAMWDVIDIGDNYNLTWQTTSAPTFQFSVQGDNTSWTYANITAKGIVIEQITTILNDTNYTWAGTSYGDCSSNDCIDWNFTLCKGTSCQTSDNAFFGVDSNAPNITQYWPLGGVWSTSSTNWFNFTGDDINNKSAILYVSTNKTLVEEKGQAGIVDALHSDYGSNWSAGGAIDGGENNFTAQSLNGTYYWNIGVNDSAGNVAYAYGGSSGYLTLNVDADNPEIVGQPASTTNSSLSRQYFNVTCGDANPNEAILTLDGVENNSAYYTSFTKIEFSSVLLSDGLHEYNFTCDDDAGNTATTTTYWLNIDTITPILTINDANDTWDTDGSWQPNLTISETNPDTCQLWGSFVTTGSQTFTLNQSINYSGSVTGQADVFLEDLNLADTTYPTPYYYNVTCNDTSGNVVSATGVYALNVDTVTPTGVNMTAYVGNYTFAKNFNNGSTGTIRNPPVSWIGDISARDTNFKELIIYWDTDVNFGSPDFIQHVTNYSGTNFDNSTVLNDTLELDTTYYYTVNVTDYAGNTASANSTDAEYYTYTTSSIGATIYPGYNYLTIWRDEADHVAHGLLNASELVEEIGDGNIDIITTYNSSGNFKSYDIDTPSINGDMELPRGQPVIIHNNGTSNIRWGGNRIYNLDLGNTSSYSINMTNNTNPWHLLPMLVTSGRNFQDIEDGLGNATGNEAFAFNPGITNATILPLNITDVDGIDPFPSMDYINYTQSYPYFPSFGYPWNNTKINYGETFWLQTTTTYNSICYNMSSGDSREC